MPYSTVPRHPANLRNQNYPGNHKKNKGHYRFVRRLIILVLAVTLGLIIKTSLTHTSVAKVKGNTDSSSRISESTHSKVSAAPSGEKVQNNTVTNPLIVNECNKNTISQVVIVSISQRHLWACNFQTLKYNSPVVTGMEFLAADLTPTGTYTILDKQTNIDLIGSDSTGSWNDPVSYWMGFLTDQYGQYGFHDATWRPNSAFGNVSPNSTNASHGCVELPLATAKWLYAWVQVGTQVQINS